MEDSLQVWAQVEDVAYGMSSVLRQAIRRVRVHSSLPKAFIALDMSSVLRPSPKASSCPEFFVEAKI